MPGINDKYNIVLEVLTPLSIGAGAEKDWVKGMDYVVNNNNLYKINLAKIKKAGFDLNLLCTYFANKDSDSIIKLVGNRLSDVCDGNPMDLPVQTDNDIKAFIKNELSGKPIVPGSSLKGAIRSILFEYFKDQNEDEERRVFGNPNDGNDFMRFVKFSDIEFEKTKLYNTKIFNLIGTGGRWIGGWKNGRRETGTFRGYGFNTIYESLPPNEIGFGSLMLSDAMFESIGRQYHNHYEEKKDVLSIERLFARINEHTRNYLIKERYFFDTYQDREQYSIRILSCIERLIKQIPEDNSYCIFKMSAGSGFHSITGDWQFDDYSINGVETRGAVSRGLLDGRKSSKSRKIAIDGNDFSLMGFVKMYLATDEQITAYNCKKDTERQQAISMIEKEKQIREEAERKQEEIRINNGRYDALLLKAKDSYIEGNYSEALSFYKDAFSIKQTSEIENIINDIIKDIERKQLIDQSKQKDEKDRQEKIAYGLKVLDELNLKGEYKVKVFKNVEDRVKDWLRKSKNAELPSDQDTYLMHTLKRIYALATKECDKVEWNTLDSVIWSTVAKWCGTERTKIIFDFVHQD